MNAEPHQEQDDAALLAATANGEGDAFSQLVRRYIRAATLLAVQLLGSRDDADDVVQDAFTVVYRRLHDFDRSRPFAPWLFGIVRHGANATRRRDLRRKRLMAIWGRFAGERYALPTEASDPVALATDAMQQLAPMQRACFELVALRGLAIATVAEMHGISESTVRQHVFRARRALQTSLEDNDARA